MKLRGLITGAAVLLALVLLLLWSNRHDKSEAEKPSKTADSITRIINITAADINKVTVKKKDNDEAVLTRNGEGKWDMTAPKPLPVDPEAATNLVSLVATLDADKVVEDKTGDWARYGLTNPAADLNVTTKSGKTYHLMIGDDTPAGSGAAYARLDGDPRVFTVSAYNKNSLSKTAAELRDKRLITVDSDKLSRVELNVQTKGKAASIEFGRNKDSWTILKPKPLRADNLQVGEMVRKVQDAKMDAGLSEEDGKKSAAAFASGTPVATVKVTDASKTQELQVRKNKDDYYAKSTAVEGVYKVTSDVGSALDKSLDDFRNKKLFDFGLEADPNKVEVHDGSKSYTFVKTGADWQSNGKTMDATSVQSFLDQVRALAATKFVETGFTASTIELTVTSGDGKRVEKVEISKNGDKYVARRENEPSLYELDSKTVTDLETAAGDVKPPTPAKK